MAVDTNFASLFEKLKVEDAWLPPSTWESIPSQNAASRRSHSGHLDSSSSPPLVSSVSETSLVRLALNAMQGVASALLSIEKLSVAFYSDSADRTYHRIPSLWSRSSSTQAMGKILNSIGCFGCLVFLLRKFVDHFTCLSSETYSPGRKLGVPNVVAEGSGCYGNTGDVDCPPYSLVNQAYAVAVGKVLEGYICSLNTVCASVGLRHSSNAGAPLVQSSEGTAPLTSVVHPEVTLLEIYLHTKELRTRIEALGNICNLHSIALSFSVSSFEELGAKANSEFINFHRGGNLLSHLYGQLQVADPGHCTLLKFLFLRSFEPYYGFIRSWIFKAEITDPYKEFVVEYVGSLEPHPYGNVGMHIELPLPSIKERDGVSVPCFLKDSLSPIIRAGQQLQVLKKLLEFCAYVGSDDHTYDDFLPSWNGYSSNHMFCTTPLIFSKGYLEEMVIARNNYYVNMQDKIEKLLSGLELRYQQVAPPVFGPVFLERDNGSVQNVDLEDRAVDRVDSEFSHMKVENQEFDFLDASDVSECSSASDSEEESNSELIRSDCVIQDQRYLSALRFSKCSTTDSPLPKPTRVKQPLLVDSKSHVVFEKTQSMDHMSLFQNETPAGNLCASSYIWTGRGSCITDRLRTACATENQWLHGLANISGCSEQHNSSLEYQTNRETLSGGPPLFTRRMCTKNGLIKEVLGNVLDTNDNPASGISSILSWETRYGSDFLSGTPMLGKLKHFHLGSKPLDARLLAYFNFSTVVDPCTASLEKVDSNAILDSRSQLPSSSNDPLAIKIRHEKHKHFGEDGVILYNYGEVPSASSPANLKEHNQAGRVPADVCGGDSWEKLLGSSHYTGNASFGGHRESAPGVFRIPLDFIVDKCLVQEILLQYKYVSKLVIKMLEEGFGLQEHLLAMRRYFFMESADWADLFIMSLQDHRRNGLLWRWIKKSQRFKESLSCHFKGPLVREILTRIGYLCTQKDVV
ncbi:unnamed protein product [Linum tenue]|uniref:Gamma-tubulin complex component n=1 Tax=Linum tenue TaxID=586396 RepID=A0AAV0N1Y3_9ROSI|nr:unnamed protein product [Linum tenue]